MNQQDFLRAQDWLDEHRDCWRGGSDRRITLVAPAPSIVKSYIREFNYGHGYEDGIDYSCDPYIPEELTSRPYLTYEEMYALGVH